MNKPVCNGHFDTESKMLAYLNSRDRPINIISIFHDAIDEKWKCYYQYLDQNEPKTLSNQTR